MRDLVKFPPVAHFSAPDHVFLCKLGCNPSLRGAGAWKTLRHSENERSPVKPAGYYLVRLFELI
jgi:hypothetical protein